MKRPDLIPHCHVHPKASRPSYVVSEALALEAVNGNDWCFDAGASCGNACSLDQWERNIDHTPGCMGCIRGLRGLLIAERHAKPHMRRMRTGELA